MLAKGNAFFEECIASDEPFTITGLALALGFASRQTLVEYESTELFGDTVKKLKMRCENYCERKALKTNGAGAIFALKNYGWTDRIAHTGADNGPIQLVTSIPKVGSEE